MFYGGLQTNKLQRRYRKYYSADGSMEIKVDTQNNNATEFITYIGGGGYTAPIVLKSNGTTQNYLYLHRDYQGSILAITDAAGAVVEKRLFDAWGSLINYYSASGALFGGWGAFDRGYTGHEHLQSVGLIHMNGRLYDPKLHRFLQTDNYVQDPTNTQNYNRYGYVLNNPLKYTDPSGWLTEEEKAKKAQEDAEQRIRDEYAKAYAEWYGQQFAVGADGLTSQQWANLGGAGVNSQMYNSYVKQNRDGFNRGLNYVMQQNASFTEQLTARGINPYGKFDFTDENAMAKNIGAIKELRMLFIKADPKISDYIFAKEGLFTKDGIEAVGAAEMLPNNSWEVSLSMTRIVTNLDFAYTIGHELTHVLNMSHMNYADYNSRTSTQIYQEELNVWTNFNQVYGDPNAQARINYYQNLLKK